MKCKLVVEDWQRDGRSIYSTPEGVRLSAGDLHSGTTFHACVQLPPDIEKELRRAYVWDNAYVVMAIIPEEASDE